MTPAPIPADDADRLAALRQLLILDTAPDERFDKIVAFAAYEFDAPIVLISLIDSERQWFKSRLGVDVCETPREMSFCGHAIVEAGIMVVPDAAVDPRFADNPMVINSPFIRFYAGAPLTLASGHTVGTLCIADMAPRQFDATSLAILSTLRDLVVQELSLPGGGGNAG
ncbi:MAG: putative sensor protein [Massilia sp.]|jgi:GAF domain-containing protein|nr:putative sensor protein [Massilia sp.]MDB5949405.1 putative sensor protein [Massilia sp.]